jgi:hypothetical protein
VFNVVVAVIAITIITITLNNSINIINDDTTATTSCCERVPSVSILRRVHTHILPPSMSQPVVVQCSVEVENAFGPQVEQCHGNFDFTLLFEESILCIGPVLVASILALLRIWQLWRREERVYRGMQCILKQVSLFCLILGKDLLRGVDRVGSTNSCFNY